MSRFIKHSATGDILEATAIDHAMCHEPARNLFWTAADAIDKDVTFDEAVAAVAALNEQRFCGFDDWRLPTVEELFLLADRSREYPAIDTDAFPTTKNDWYWTSTLDCASPSDCAWFVYFHHGSSHYSYRDGRSRVRAVRGPAGQ